MNKENLLFAIETLEEDEKYELLRFMLSPFLKLHAVDRDLLHYLVYEGIHRRDNEKFIEGQNSRKWQHQKFKERVCREALKKHPNALEQWTKIFNRCYNAVNEFIIHQSTRKEILRNNILMEHYAERNGGEKISRALCRKMEKGLLEEGSRDYYHYYYKFRLSQFRIIDSKAKTDNSDTDMLEQCSSNLDTFYVENKLRIFNAILTRGVDSSISFDDDLMNIIVGMSKGEANDEFEMMRDMFCFFFEKKEIDIARWLTHIKSSAFLHLDKHMQKTLLGYLLNYCAIQVNAKKEEYIGLYLEGVHYLMENGLLLDNNEISWRRYQTIIGFYITDKKYEDAGAFMKKYSVRLNSKYRDLAEVLARASLDEDIPQSSDLKNINGNIWGRIRYERLLMKYYLKHNHFDALQNQIKSFNLMLWRTQGKLSDEGYARIKGLITIAKKIIKKHKENKPTERIVLSNDDIDNTQLYGLDFIWIKNNYCGDGLS